MYIYGTAQWQLDTRKHVNSKKRAGLLNEGTYSKPARVPSTIKICDGKVHS